MATVWHALHVLIQNNSWGLASILDFKKCNLTLKWAHLLLYGILLGNWALYNGLNLQKTLSKIGATYIEKNCKFNSGVKSHFSPGDLKSSTFDIWPWPLRSTYGPSLLTLWPNFINVSAIFTKIWLFIKSETWPSHRQKVMHMSPPCTRTGGLKNWTEIP